MENIDNSDSWNKLLDHFPDANFLQSWEWGEFNKNIGNAIYRIAIPSQGPSFSGKDEPYKASDIFLAIVERAKRATYLTVPGGPLVGCWNQKALAPIVATLRDIAKKESCSFIRIRPQVFDTPEHRSAIQELGFRPAPMHLHAELTRTINLTKTDEELFSEMRKSTRYEIKKALKMGLEVHQSDDEKLIEEFVQLQKATAAREHFVPFSKIYLLEQFKALKTTGAVRWFYTTSPKKDEILSSMTGSHPSICKPISMAFVIFYRNEAVYHYAASSVEARNVPAAYALQWAIMQEAKKRGCKKYNLWGDVPDGKLSTHRFSGPSLFKRGFGGQQVSYLHAHDLPLNITYWANWSIETVRKHTRSL